MATDGGIGLMEDDAVLSGGLVNDCIVGGVCMDGDDTPQLGATASLLGVVTEWSRQLARDLTVHHNVSVNERPAVTSDNWIWSVASGKSCGCGCVHGWAVGLVSARALILCVLAWQVRLDVVDRRWHRRVRGELRVELPQ